MITMNSVRTWLQRKLGTPPEAEARIAELITEGNQQRGRIVGLVIERDRALRELHTEQEAHSKTTKSLHRQINQLLEPPASDECTKIRLRDRPEATEFLAGLAERVNKDPNVLRAYACKICPRHPLTGSRVWHVGHATTPEGWAAREQSKIDHSRRVRKQHEAGTAIGARVSPDVLARLKIETPAD